MKMSSLDKLEIFLENSIGGKFITGSLVHGKLVLTLRGGLKVQGIEVKVRGRCRAEWWEDENKHLYETEEYMRLYIIVYGKEPDREAPHVEYLESGKHVFNFEFTIPENIPSSFEGMHGYVRYWLKAKIHGVWGLIDQSGKVEFGVERPLDLNKVPGAEDFAEDEDSCIICGCCLNQGAIFASLRINRRGFVPGESIICDASVFNGSSSSIKSTKLKLYQLTTYGDSPFESITREKWTICEIIRGKIKAGQEETYTNEFLQLPESLSTTSLPGCSFIDTDFVAELKVDFPKENTVMRLSLLVIIGTVPLKNSSFPKSAQPIRDIIAESEGIPPPTVLQSESISGYNDDATSAFNDDQSVSTFINTMTSSDPHISGVAPMATELDEYYPPVAELSISKRERTLNNIYGERRTHKVLKLMSSVNEGIEVDENEENV